MNCGLSSKVQPVEFGGWGEWLLLDDTGEADRGEKRKVDNLKINFKRGPPYIHIDLKFGYFIQNAKY